ncbi:hypothetical protein [Nocardiopsis sp. YSL2]|uniref:hypothetical protein n=1 Tax=Nocardiopsis sp. YSL2 TaxID=2939492 RepID=UPI0026F44085|nr:hypothetical protein [Nocardiopsis sp. YSL2]
MRAELSRIDAEDVLELRLDSGHGDQGAGLALRRRGDGEAAIRVTDLEREGARVRAPLAGLPISEGVWDVLWIDGEGRSAPLATRDTGLSLADRLTYLRGRHERELRTFRDRDGRLRLRSAAATPYAEVGWVDVDTGTGAVSVSGVLAYAPDDQGADTAEVVARQRGLDGRLAVPAELDGARFHCVIPLAPIADAHEHERRHNEWDLWLRTPGGGRGLRLAMHADDIVGKKRKIVYPEAVVDAGERAGGAAAVRIRPYYTVKDELSLLAVEHAGGGR